MNPEPSTQERESILLDLASADEEVRRLAVERLGALPSSEALPRLVECLGDADWRVRKSAVERLVSSAESDRVLEALIQALADGENPGRRNSAVEALVEIGESAVAALIETLGSDDVDVRKFAVDALAGIGSTSALDAMLHTLGDGDPNVRAAAADALGLIGGERSVEALLARSVDGAEDPLVRFSALSALARLEAPVTAHELASALDDSTLRAAAFAVLGRRDDPEAVDRLLKGVVSGSRAARESAMEALLRLLSGVDGSRADRLVSEIRAAVSASDSLVDALVDRLGAADLASRLVHVQFMGLLRDPRCVKPILAAGHDEAIREVAHRTLVEAGEVAEAAIDDAWSALDVDLRCDACRILARLGGARGVQRLLGALQEEDADLRGTAARALGRRGCSESVEAMIERLRIAANSDDFEAEDEVEALVDGLVALVDPERVASDAAARAIELLAGNLDGASEPFRHAIASIFGRIDQPVDAELVGMLLRDPSSLVRRAAVDALTRLDGAVAAEPLRLALADESPEVRASAAGALASVRGGAVLEDLRRLLHDEDERVRAAAVRAIGSLGSEAGPGAAGEAIGLVRLALEDAGRVALAAADALRCIGGPEAARSAAALLTRSEPELVQAAVACVGEHGDGDTVEELMAVVAHDFWAVRADAIQALADRRVARAIPAILRRLETEQDDFVRDTMLRGLRRLEELP